MNETVERLRDAAGAVGETVRDVPAFRPRARRTRRPWVVPLVAAAAVTGVIAGGVVAVRGGEGESVAGPATAQAAPEYFAMTGGDGITFHRSDTGRTTGALPGRDPGRRFSLVDSARGAFYTTVTLGACETLFLRVTLGRAGEVVRTDTLPVTVPDGTTPTSLAASADGTTLAYGLRTCRPSASVTGRLGVTDLTTGKSRTFVSASNSDVTNVSITADGRTVAFQRGPALPDPDETSTVTATRFPDPVPSAAPPSGPEVFPTVPLPDSVPPSAAPPSDSEVFPTVPFPDSVPRSAAPPSDPEALPTTPDSRTTPADPKPVKPPTPTRTVMVTPTPGLPDRTAAVPPGRTEPTVSAAPTGPVTVSAIPTEPATVSAAPTEPATPSPSETATVTPTPDLSVPTSLVSTSVPEPAREAGPGSPEVWVLDIQAAGEDLDGARKVELKIAAGTPAGLHGVRIGADGRSFVAAPGRIIEENAGERITTVAGATTIALFDAGDGRQTGVLYRDDRGDLRLVDGDASGEHLIVQRGSEFGAVASGRYRALTGFTAPGGPGNSEIGW
ncbi:hypothetical protein ACQPYK_01665 [Streptosporangium sp. CA-135522]|uniref:hypothetical protein n=1 Tax=Streptosporangium sp. CA-135522 TaxID=3240072 RepID=UPI003D8D25A6